jgi:hypothetical protein
MAKDKYNLLIDAYMIHFRDAISATKKNKNFLMLKGLNALTHIFNITLEHTNDLNRAVENTQLAINYYTQFIEQIEENSIYDLNLCANSAVLFIYKKTIFDYPYV